jgi:translation initiation factor 4E
VQPTTDYLLFLSSVRRPVWEDPLNISGGKWILRLRKGVADRLWEDLVLGVIGEQFDEEDEICGCVLSVRSQEDILSVWNRDEKDSVACNRIRYVAFFTFGTFGARRSSSLHSRDTIKRLLNLNQATNMEYKSNNGNHHTPGSKILILTWSCLGRFFAGQE